MNKVKCSKCGKSITCRKEKPRGDDLPYRWTYFYIETGGEHDSASIHYKSEHYLCPKCSDDVLIIYQK